MALTITYTGTGIVAYADGQTTDTGGGAWGELGAGTVGDNPDVYLYGSNSFGSQYASKAGRTYYTDNAPINFSTTGDLIYMLINIQSNGAFRTYGTGARNGSFNMIVGQDTSNLRHWNIAAKGASNGWTGGWKAFVLDPSITTGTEVEGTPATTAIDVFGVWVDTDVSVRADSIFQSMIIAAKGATVTGSPTTTGGSLDELAAWCTDYTNRAFPFMEVRGTTYFQKGGLTVGDGSTATTFSATGNNVECEESSYYTGSVWASSYPSNANHITTTANASLALVNVNWAGFTANKLIWNTSAGNASSMSGGALKLVSSLTVKASDTFSGVVFSTNDALSLGAATYTGCTFNNSGSVTILATTPFTNNNFGAPSGTTALITPSLSNVEGCDFVSGGTGHAIELTATGTFDWDGNTYSGYGADGTTNAVLYNNSGGAVTVNVNSGDTPTVLNGSGASTTIVAGAVTVQVTATLKDGTPVETARVYLKASDGTGPFPFEETVTSITRASTTATVTHTAHGLATDDKIVLKGITDKTEDNYIVKQVTVTGVDAYTYPTTDSGSTNYTGTIKSTFVALNDVTNASGIASISRVYPTNQPVVGWTRKSSSAPYLQEGVLVGVVNSSTGFSGTAVMLSDQ